MSASLGRPVESLMFATAYATGANSNETLWSNDHFMSLFKQALATLDDAKRRELYREMQMIIRDDDGEIVYAFQHSLDGHSVKIAHPDVVSNIGELDGFRVAERWWFA
jgi:peptide/nickel transport system substrate-binding protein